MKDNAPDNSTAPVAAAIIAADQGLAGCHVCGRVSSAEEFTHCPRCGAPLHLRKPHSLERT